MPEHRVNMAGDLRSILGTDVPATAEVFGRDIVGWTIFGIDRGKNVDRGGDLRSGGQCGVASLRRSTHLSLPRRRGRVRERPEERAARWHRAFDMVQRSCG